MSGDKNCPVCEGRGYFFADASRGRQVYMYCDCPANIAEREADASPCPKCGAWVTEPGEFGVLRHEACGYCAHPSRDWCEAGWVCVVCGDLKPFEKEVVK